MGFKNFNLRTIFPKEQINKRFEGEKLLRNPRIASTKIIMREDQSSSLEY